MHYSRDLKHCGVAPPGCVRADKLAARVRELEEANVTLEAQQREAVKRWNAAIDDRDTARSECESLRVKLAGAERERNGAVAKLAKAWEVMPKLIVLVRAQAALASSHSSVKVESDNVGWCLECIEKKNLDALCKAVGMQEGSS